MAIVIICLPVEYYYVTSKFGMRNGKMHNGVDLAPKKYRVDGDPIYAVQSGIVHHRSNPGGYGTYIIVEHPNYGFCTLYGHLSGYTTADGATVMAGQQIGKMGNTGHSSGTHLHFEIRQCTYSKYFSTSAYNPQTYLEKPSVVTPSGGNVVSSGGLSDYSNAGLGSSGISLADNYEYTYEKVTLDENSLTETGNVLFGRVYRIAVYNKYGQGFDLSDLHIVFDVNKSITLDNSTGTITIYNLNVEYENEIITNCNRVTIEAGYEGLFGLIYDGDIIQVIRGVENGTDFYITLVTMDGDRFLNSGFTTYSIPKGASKRNAAETICAVSTNATEIASLSSAFEKSNYIRGKAVFGKAKDYLDELASGENANFYTENGMVKLTSVSDLPEDTILRIDSSSGLIGSPQQNQMGINFQALLNPRIKLNSLVNIPNSQIVEQQYSDGSATVYQLDTDNVYRVLQIQYQGDTRGQNWYVNCSAASQAGAIPTILADVISNTSTSTNTSEVYTSDNILSNDSSSTFNVLSYDAGNIANSKVDGSVKSFMDYRAITSKSTLQYKLQHDGKCFTNAKGFRVHYSNMLPGVVCNMVAMGTYYGYSMSEYKITLSSGLTFYAMIGDTKKDSETDALHRYHLHDGSVIEFIIDKNVFYKVCEMARKMGDCSYAGFQGSITNIQTIRKVSASEANKINKTYK